MNSFDKRKREYEEEQKQKESVYSFSKIIKFTITDNIESRGEILFWKLFRNKVIYKTIFSFMDNRFSINYDSMSSITNLIDNNKINILKEKVYRNCRYLYSNYYELEPAIFFVKLFSKIKDDDYKFYRNLLNGDNCYYNLYSTISTALILSKNLKIFKLYINEFNYEPTETDLFYSIIIGSNEFIKYLLVLNSPKSSILQLFFLKYKNLIFKISRSYYPIEKIKIFKGLLCFLNIIGDHNYESYEKNNHQIAIDDLIGSFSKNPYNIGNGLEFNERSTLKTLITICKLILLLKKSVYNEITLIKETLRQSSKSITTAVTIQQIDDFIIIQKIDKQTLKSILEDPINFNNNNNKEVKCFIKKLLNLYQLTFKYIPVDLYLCYYDFGDDPILDHNHIVGNKYKAAFKFGNFELLQGLDLSYDRLLPKNLGNFTNNPLCQNSPYTENFIVLFSHCFDREKKNKFIDQLIKRNTKKQELDFQNHFFYMLIMHGDIELLKYFSNKVGTKFFYFDSNDKIIPPTYYIESIEMLEYLFNNHRNYFIDSQFPNGYCTFFKSLQFLQHFESLLIQYKSNNPSIIEKDPISFIRYNFDFKRNKDYLELIYHFATNSLYNNDRNECVYLLSIHSKDYEINQIQPFPTPLETKGTFSMKYLKLLDSAFTDNNHELEITSKYYNNNNNKDHYYHFLFVIDRCDLDDNSNYCTTINSYYDLKNVDFLFRLSSLIDLVNSRTPYLYELNNFKFLNWFLTKIKNYYYSSNTTSTQKSKIKCMLHEFMIKNISNSRLKVLEYIHQNFDFILKKESDGRILTSDDLTSYLNRTISGGLIKVSEFLSQFITLTKDKLEIISNEKLKLYFLNKLNK
ncbi:hypothetical protein ACTFIR_009858 [Dictyostelium discoideum]